MKGLLHNTGLGWQIQYIKRLITHDSEEAVRCVNIPVQDPESSLISKENELIDFDIIELLDGSSVAKIVSDTTSVFNTAHAGISKMGTGPGAKKIKDHYSPEELDRASLLGQLSALLKLRAIDQRESQISHNGRFIKVQEYIELKTEEAKRSGWM